MDGFITILFGMAIGYWLCQKKEKCGEVLPRDLKDKIKETVDKF